MEHGYFAGAKGEDEAQIDQRFNQAYELPFNKLLPIIDADIHIFESSEIRETCALYVAHIFHRMRALRSGGDAIRGDLLDQFRAIAREPKLLLQYSAMISFDLRRSVKLHEVRSAIVLSLQHLESDDAKQSDYVNDLDRATKSLANQLKDLKWSVLVGTSERSFCISDTPVVSISVSERGETSYGDGIKKPFANWILPISHKRALRISHVADLPRKLSMNMVQELNAAQVVTMSKRLYGRERDQWLERAVQDYGSIYKFHRDVFRGEVLGIDDLLTNLGV